MMSALRTLAWRMGLHPVPPSRGILFIGEPSARVARIAAALRAAFPRLNLYRVSDVPAADDTQFIDVAGPFAFESMIRWYLRRLKIQVMIVHGAPNTPGTLFELGRQMGIPLVCIGSPKAELIDVAPRLALCAVTAAEEAAARNARAAAAAILIDGSDADHLDRLKPLLVSARAPGKLAANVEAKLAAGLRKWIGSGFREIESLAELAGHLSRPRSVMCLGNGPSSEDPELSGLGCDVVFRVNHSWLTRGLYERPDVIFTGKRDTLNAYRAPTVFGLQTDEAASRIMLRSLFVRRAFTYFTAERLRCMDFERFLPYKPTNGAVMIATAVALAPERIVVAGMDLFSDPRGSYPGDSGTPNAYTVAHEREVEAGFILDALGGFTGEVIVVGEVLKARWQRHLLESKANS